MKRKNKKFQNKNKKSLNKLSLFQKPEGRFNRVFIICKKQSIIDHFY